MSWRDYIQQNPRLVQDGDAWTRNMTPADVKDFDFNESAFIAWEQNAFKNTGPLMTGWQEWIAGTTKGFRLLMYAQAYDDGTEKSGGVAATFPAIIQKPASSGWHKSWLLALKPFSDIRNRMMERGVLVVSDDDNTHDVIDIGGVGPPATTAAGAALPSADGGSLWLVLAILGILALTDALD